MTDFTGYGLVGPIGAGGNGTVYEALQLSTDRHVAIKVLNVARDRMGSIERELRALISFGDHPNVMQVIDAGRIDGGRPYLVMPLYRNGTLSDLITARGALDLETTLRMGVKLCGALHALSEYGFVHRDVKPSNIMMTAFGDVVLSDFGLAVPTAALSDGSEETAFTPFYAAPEVLKGAPASAASDVYSLAATLYTCITGRPPLSDVPASLFRRLTEPVPRLSEEYDRMFADLLERAMGDDPDDRPDALEFASELRHLQAARGFPPTELVLRRDAPPIDRARRAADRSGTDPGAPGDAADRLRDPRDVSVVLDGPTGASVHGPGAWKPVGEAAAGVWSAAPTAPRSPPAAARPYDTVPPRPSPTAAGAARVPLRPIVTMLRAFAHALALVGGLLGGVPRFAIRLLRRVEPPGAASSVAATGTNLYQISADRPTPVDLLERFPLVKGLARVLNDPGTALPITIAICGEWGSGKSSLMMQLAAELNEAPASEEQPREWLPIRFDAWRFQGREAFWAALARAIYQQTQAALPNYRRRIAFRMRLERRRRGRAPFYGGLAVCAAGAAFVVWSGVAAWLGAHTWLTFAGLGGGATALTAAATYVGLLREPFKSALAHGSVTNKFDDFLGISDAAERDIEALLAAVIHGHPTRCLVVLLDDLDRCQESLITEALAAITEVFGRQEGRRVCFVLGIDLEVVTSAVDHSLSALQDKMRRLNPRRAAEMSEQFLEKVFQLSVSVDGHRRQDVRRLLFHGSPDVPVGAHTGIRREFQEQVSRLRLDNPADLTGARRQAGLRSMAMDPAELLALHSVVRVRRSSLLSVASADVRFAEQATVASLRLTPRAAKRFDNAFRLQLQVANSTPGCELSYDRDSLTAVAKWVALRMFFQPVVRLVDQRPGLLSELEEMIGSEVDGGSFFGRLRELAPEISAGALTDLGRLLRVNLPASALTRLPLDTFATTTM